MQQCSTSLQVIFVSFVEIEGTRVGMVSQFLSKKEAIAVIAW